MTKETVDLGEPKVKGNAKKPNAKTKFYREEISPVFEKVKEDIEKDLPEFAQRVRIACNLPISPEIIGKISGYLVSQVQTKIYSKLS